MKAIFLDMETTGLDFQQHCPIDVAFKIIDMNSKKLQVSYEAIIKQPVDAWGKRDPNSILINGFSWEQVLTGKEPSQVTQEIIHILTEAHIERGKAVFICQNPAFDKSFFAQLVDIYTQERLNWPYHWLDLASMYWAMLVKKSHQKAEPLPECMNLSKNEIAKVFHLLPEGEPHRAANGVNHLIQCYCAVLGERFL